MRRKSTILFTLLMILLISSAATIPGSKFDPLGKWKFSAPYAPYGYNTGTIEISLSEEKEYVAILYFENSEFAFYGENVTFSEDIFAFSIFLEGEEIPLKMKLDEDEKMSGSAITPDGEILITARKDKS